MLDEEILYYKNDVIRDRDGMDMQGGGLICCMDATWKPLHKSEKQPEGPTASSTYSYKQSPKHVLLSSYIQFYTHQTFLSIW